jgi:hypothetical protein
VVPRRPTNDDLADMLDQVAALLRTEEDANPFRVRAYETAAATLRSIGEEAGRIVERDGRKGLEELPGIGSGLAGAVEQAVVTGRLPMLERLQREASPETLFAGIPGIGPTLSRRVVDTLDVETLEELESAAHDGRLHAVPGFGDGRVRLVRDALAARLDRGRRIRSSRASRNVEAGGRPDVGLLLEVDEDYRERAGAGDLPLIAPRRFNPGREAWLPVLRDVKLDGWTFTALFSNTGRAHELDKTDEWVVIYYRKDAREEQCTVVTEKRGRLAGKRVVRGREAECAEHYGVVGHGRCSAST